MVFAPTGGTPPVSSRAGVVRLGRCFLLTQCLSQFPHIERHDCIVGRFDNAIRLGVRHLFLTLVDLDLADGAPVGNSSRNVPTDQTGLPLGAGT